MVGLDCMDSREASSCQGCGVCLQVCPTGALFNRYRTHGAVGGQRAVTRVHEGVCPLCGLLCPVLLHVQDGRLIAVEGRLGRSGRRPDRGQLCRRGRFDVFKDPGPRLTRPLERMPDNSWQSVSWDQALTAAATGLGEIRRRYGGQAILGWTSSMASNEELLFFKDMMFRTWSAGWIDALDGAYLRAVAAVLDGGEPSGRQFPWQRIGEADMVLLAGADPLASQPLLVPLLRQLQKEKGAVLAAIGPRTCPPPLICLHLSPSRDCLARVVRAFGAAVKQALQETSLRHRNCDPLLQGADGQRLLREAGLDPPQTAVGQAMVEAYAAAERPLIMIGPWLDDPQGPPVLEALWAMAQLKQTKAGFLNLLCLKSNGNSCGAWHMGAACGRQSPGTLFKGGVLRLSGDVAEAESALARLDALDYLVVLTPYLNEKVQARANLLIPIPLWLETDGSYLSLDGSQWARQEAVLPPPEGVRPLWRTLGRISRLAAGEPAEATWEELHRQVRALLEEKDINEV